MFILLLFCIEFLTSLSAAEKWSATKLREIPSNFGTKTSYFVNSNNSSGLPIIDANCTPLYVWHLARHGTRNPGEDEILEMGQILPIIRDKLIVEFEMGNSNLLQQTIEKFIEWRFDLTLEDDSMLTSSGQLEHFQMGERWRERLDQFSLDITRAEAITSPKLRCVESGDSFLQGFFGSEQTPELTINANLTRFYDDCPKYAEEVDNNIQTTREAEAFVSGPEFQAILTRVEAMTGVGLSMKEIDLSWEICRFEIAWYPGLASPWCDLFSQLDLQLFQFREDLLYYYYDGFAYNITTQMTQPLWEHLLDRLDSVVTEVSPYTSSLLFSHTEALLPFSTSLQLHRDPMHLKASDWPATERKWDTSKIGSFGNNIDVILLQCDDTNNETVAKLDSFSHKIAVLKNEKAEVVPSCGETLCDLENFRGFYSHLASADFNSVCAVEENGINK